MLLPKQQSTPNPSPAFISTQGPPPPLVFFWGGGGGLFGRVGWGGVNACEGVGKRMKEKGKRANETWGFSRECSHFVQEASECGEGEEKVGSQHENYLQKIDYIENKNKL